MPNFDMPVNRYMKAPVHTVHVNSTLSSTYKRLRDLAISSLAVIDDAAQLIGVISRSDLLRIGRHETEEQVANQGHQDASARLLHFPERSLGDLMTRDVLRVGPDDTVAEACQHMLRRQVHRVFVTSEGKIVGVLSTRDVMQVVRDLRLETSVEDLMSRPVFTIAATESVSLAATRLEQARITGLVVVDDDWPVGLFTQLEALRSRDLPGETRVEDAMNPAFVCMPMGTRVFRAAEQAVAMNVRRIIVSQQRDMAGIVSGLDFVRAAST